MMSTLESARTAGIADLAVLRCEHKVAEGDEFSGAGETVAVNLRDYRLIQVPDRRVGVN